MSLVSADEVPLLVGGGNCSCFDLMSTPLPLRSQFELELELRLELKFERESFGVDAPIGGVLSAIFDENDDLVNDDAADVSIFRWPTIDSESLGELLALLLLLNDAIGLSGEQLLGFARNEHVPYIRRNESNLLSLLKRVNSLLLLISLAILASIYAFIIFILKMGRIFDIQLNRCERPTHGRARSIPQMGFFQLLRFAAEFLRLLLLCI